MNSAISPVTLPVQVPMAAADQAKLLVGDTDGWALAPVVAWLFSEGVNCDDPEGLVIGMAGKLEEVGAPISRFRLAYWTIHPQVAAHSYVWHRGNPRIASFAVPHGIFNSPSYIGSPAEDIRTSKQPKRYRLSEGLDPEKDHQVLFELRDEGATDYLALPMVTFGGNVDSLFIATDRESGFDDADIAKLTALSRFLMPVIETHSQHRLSVTLLDTYVGERTGRRVLGGQIKRGDGELIEAALWFSDLRDFTPLTETLPPDELLGMLNAYFEFVYNAVTSHGGEVLRFIGDAMLVVFPTEKCGDATGACKNALNAAEDAFSSLAVLNNRRRRAKQPEIRFGVGLHVGTVIYGNVGAPNRLDFTVMGPAVNRTARLEGLTKVCGTPLLMSRDFVDRAGCKHESQGMHQMKGVVDAQEVFSCPELNA